MEGRVVLRVAVSAEGAPLQVDIHQSSGFGALDRAALKAVRRWRFSPATRDGAPTEGVVHAPVVFRLN